MIHQTDVNRNTMTFPGGTRNGIKFCTTNNKSIPCQKHSSWDSYLPVPSLHPLWASCIVFFAALLCFVNSLQGDFVFDDSEAVVNNHDLRPDVPLSNLFKNDFWGTRLTHSTSHKSYRPLTILTFRWNYALCGLHPISFHLINILLHGTVSVLTLHVFQRIFFTLLKHEPAPRASFLSALLFAVHPVHTESVSAVVGRADLLCALFFLLSFLSYIQSCSDGGIPVLRPETISLKWLVLSLVLAGISMLCKEQGITVIGVCSAYDVVVLCRVDFENLLQSLRRFDRVSSTTSPQPKSWIWSLLLRQAILFVGGLLLLVCRWQVMGSVPPAFQRVDNPASFEDSLLVRVVNYHYIYALNLWLLFHPLWLCFDWSMGCIPIIRSIFDPRFIVVVLFWVVICLLVYCCFLHSDRRLRRLSVVSVALLVIPFLPASNIFFRVGFVIAERVLYLSSLGFCLLIVTGIRQLTFHVHNQVIQSAFLLIVVCWIVRSAQRSAEWQNEARLFRSGLKVCPLNAKVHYNIAKNAADNGDRQLAIYEYREAIRLNPEYDQAMNNLANILKDNGQVNEAEELLQTAVKIRPDFAAAWMNLGIVQASLKKESEAEHSYLTAIRHRKKYPDCYYNLGNLYLEQKRYEEAYQAWRNATALKQSHLVAWNNMIIMLDNTGNFEKAESVAHEALKVLPGEASLHFNLANTLGKVGKYKESEKHFFEAINLNRENPTYYTNLGVLYHRWKKYDKAEEAYQRALEIKPDLKSARENLELLYRIFNKTVVSSNSSHVNDTS